VAPWLSRAAVLGFAVSGIVLALSGPAAYTFDTVSTAHTGSIPSDGPAVVGGAFAGAAPVGGAITSWGQAYFSSTTTGGVVLYDLPASLPRPRHLCPRRRRSSGATSSALQRLRHPPLQLFGAESLQRRDLIPDQGQLDFWPNRFLHLVRQQIGVGDLAEALAVGEHRLCRFLQQTRLDLVLAVLLDQASEEAELLFRPAHLPVGT
jgi:hypothetical protein